MVILHVCVKFRKFAIVINRHLNDEIPTVKNVPTFEIGYLNASLSVISGNAKPG